MHLALALCGQSQERMAFITQGGEVSEATKTPKRETSELEALVNGVNSVSQATLLLKKMRETREVS